MQKEVVINKIAVLGAGVMGAQIAAHCVNAGIDTLLFDLTAKSGASNAIVDKAITHLQQIKPTPLATPETAFFIKPCNYDEDFSELKKCDLIIEAIAERLDWKESLYLRIAPYLADHAILVSNTSGLSINTLCSVLPEGLRTRFCGVHFFNPPRYMHLVELIPAHSTHPALLDQLETWLTTCLGKGVVRANDTPNFIANRIGVFSLLSVLHHAEALGIGLDEADALTGVFIGRPKSATCRTMDVVGLDTMLHVIETMQTQLKEDPWYAYFNLPTWLMNLIQQGHLGQKTGQGIYRKNGKIIEVYDVAKNEYRPAKGRVSDEMLALFKTGSPQEQFERLFSSDHPQARFLSACFTDLFHYSAVHLADIAFTVRDVDLAMQWGFGWAQGPFETWQAAGVTALREKINQKIAQGISLSAEKLPAWLEGMTAFYQKEKAYSPISHGYEPTSPLVVYKRQIGRKQGETLYENEGVRLYHLQDEVAVVQFKSKSNTIGQAVLDGLQESLDIAERACQGMIIYQQDANNFSSGANLKEIFSLIQAHKMRELEQMITCFQQLLMKMKYSAIPIIAAVRGRALGGGTEILLHTDTVVSAFEAYPGLVEVGVGVIPAGGGCKEMALRAADQAKQADLLLFIKPYYEQIAMATVASSAPDAQKKGYFKRTDFWMMNAEEVLFAALNQVKHLQMRHYLPPLAASFPVAGREGHARLQAGLVNWLEGKFISQHDYFMANQLASVLCGGEVNEGTLVNEEWILKLEREAFLTLAATPETQARIAHMLETGKPLRN